MADAPSEIEQLFEQLSSAINNNKHKKAIKIADDVLKRIPGDEDALKCKVVALINTEDYEAALKALPKNTQDGSFLFNKSYCLYKLSNFRQSLDALKAVPEDHPGAVELEAQLHYKLGHSKECVEAYLKLTPAQQARSSELKANVIAAYVAAGKAADVPSVMTSLKATSKESFDIGFNKVCALVESGQLPAAETELRQVLKLARESLLLEDDMTEEQIEEELAPLIIQHGYILARLGKYSDALAQYDRVLKGGQADESIAAVALNNSIADGMRAHTAPHQKKYCSAALKKLDALLDKAGTDGSSGTAGTAGGMSFQPQLEVDLSSAQKSTMHANRALLAAMAGRLDQAAQISSALVKAQGGQPDAVVLLIHASILAKSGKAAEAEGVLEILAKISTESRDQATLMKAQLALEGGNAQGGMQLLGQVVQQGVKKSPALLATRSKLCEQMGDVAGAEALLQESQGVLKGESKEQCLQQLVDLKLHLGKRAEAAAAYKQLRSLGADSSSSQVLAKLVRVTAALDTAATSTYAADLPKARPLADSELDRLEEEMRAAVPLKAQKDGHHSKKREERDAEGDVTMAPKAKKRKKKPRYPKGFDKENPGPPPDPERWLPKWQRSGYKKRGRRRDGNVVKGSQGAGKVDENLDRTKPMEVETKAEPKAAPAAKGKGKGKGKR